MKKRFLALVMSLIMLFAFCVSVNAFEDSSDVGYFEGEIDRFPTLSTPRYQPEFSFFASRYSDSEKASKLRNFLVERLSCIESYQDEVSFREVLFTDESTAYDMIYVSLDEFSTFTMYANSANIASTSEIIGTAIADMQNKFPEFFWLSNTYTFSYSRSTSKVTEIGILLNLNEDFDEADGLLPIINKVDTLTEEFDEYVKEVTDLVPDYYSDYEKILFVNDYLCTNFRYGPGSDPANYVYNAYDFFKTGAGVCQAYTLAFSAIMDELGIRCDTVTSDEMVHIWNLVELNDKWYHIDVTWNDPSFEDCDFDNLGLSLHNYFLLSSDCISDENHLHTGFNIDDYNYEIGTEYDNAKLDLNRFLRSSFIELNGVWYNTGYDDTLSKCGIYAFDFPLVSDISSADFTNAVYDIDSWGYRGSFSYLAKYDDKILFNTTDSICAFDGETTRIIYSPEKNANEKIYGFTTKGDSMYIQLAQSPNYVDMVNSTIKTVNLSGLVEYGIVIEDYDVSNDKAKISASTDFEGTLIFASYDDDYRMIDCECITYSSENKILSGTNSYSAPVDFDKGSAKYIKVMIFKSLSETLPLCDALLVSLK